MNFEKISLIIPPHESHIFSPKRTRYALLVPVLNEGQRFISQMEKMKASGIFTLCDVFICDGASCDSSANANFVKNYGCAGLFINTSDKRGQGVQLKQGFFHTLKMGYDGVVMVDGNDKDNVYESLPRFLAKLDEGYDVVQATRFTLGGSELNTPLMRKIAIRLIASPLISLTSGVHYDDVCNGYKGFSARYMLDERMEWFRESFCTYEYCYYPLVQVKKLGYKAVQVPTTRAYPQNELPSKIKGIFAYTKLLRQIILLAFSEPAMIKRS